MIDAASALVALIIADVAVRFMPFGVIVKRVRSELRKVPADDASIAIKQVKWAIGAAQRRIPWTIPCLATAIAANRLLARRGIPSEIRLGVRTGVHASIDAHAWLVANGVFVTGAREMPQFEPLYALATKPR